MSSERPESSDEGPLATLGVDSIRVRLALLVALSVVVAAVVGTIGTDAGVPLWVGLPVTIALAVLVTHTLATGFTAPLREMTAAATRMAHGDYAAADSPGVTRAASEGRDEVGALARAFTSMADDLAAAEASRRQLVATVAHELRTPLSAQQALLENLADGVTQPDEATLRAALAQSQRLGDLVRDLLDLSRADGGGVPLRPAAFPVAELLDAAVGEANLQGRDVRLTRSIDPPDLAVTADRARLAQVVSNLLDNAVRHSPAGGTVALDAAALGPDRWHLSVSDQGPGLSPERAAHLFDRFRGDGGASGGTGLGLAIAGWVVAMHGGTIEAGPRPDGPGARLVAVLPRVARDGTRLSHTSATPLAPDRAPHRKGITMSNPTPETEPANSGRKVAAGSTAGATPSAPVATGTVATTTPAAGVVPQASPPTIAAALARVWPERETRPQPRLVVLAAVVGLLAAVLVPSNEAGLGLFLVLAVGGAALWWASPHRATRWSIITAALSLLLGSSVVLRSDVGWPLLAMTTAGLLAAVACTEARTIRGMVLSVMAWPLASLRGTPLLDRTVKSVLRRGGLWPVIRTAAVSLVLLAVFGGLLASADAVLGSWVSQVIPNVDEMLVVRVFVFVFFAGITLAGLYLAINPPEVDGGRVPLAGSIPAREWQIPVVVVIVAFAAFLVAQGAALLGGHAYVLETTGVTYAEYARAGFGQLVLVTILTLLLVAAARHLGRRDTPAQARSMRLLCSVLCLLALVVVASALHRMNLYQQAYGFTIDRVLADLIELWLGLCLVVTLISIHVTRQRWAGRAMLLAGAAVVALMSVGNASAWVADRNIERFQDTGEIDVAYLGTISEDAAATIDRSTLPREIKSCVLSQTGGDSAAWPAWNLARERAATIAEQYRGDGVDCSALDERYGGTSSRY